MNESELDDESKYDSSEEDEPLDNNGKRGTCGGTEDEEEDEEEGENDDEKTDSGRKSFCEINIFLRFKN